MDVPSRSLSLGATEKGPHKRRIQDTGLSGRELGNPQTP